MPEQKLENTQIKNVDIERGGSKIVLPEGMSLDDGMEWLRRKKIEEDRDVAINEEVNAFPLDGAYALARAISRKYGFTGLVPTPSFFGPRPPVMIGVPVSTTENVQVPWGRMEIPGIRGYIQTGVTVKDDKAIFIIGGVVRQKYKAEIAELARLTRELVANESIYRGKAIRVKFPNVNDENFDPVTNAPKFLDFSNAKTNELVFSEDVKTKINDSVFVPIEKTQQCREFKIPLKRGILLEGPYGTGKTLTAYVTAKKAVDNQWTFIYLESVSQLRQAIFFAQQYGKSVIFAEDIDTVLKGNRSDEMNGILNTIDGVDTKTSEIIVVLTTNHIENINPAMLRPGRLDAVITVSPPDSKAVERLIRLYARGLLSADEKIDTVCDQLNGKIPAIVREVVERSKLSALSHLKEGEQMRITEIDLMHAARSMLNQMELTNPKNKEPENPLKVFGEAVGKEVVVGLVSSQLAKELTKNHTVASLPASNFETPAQNGTQRQA